MYPQKSLVRGLALLLASVALHAAPSQASPSTPGIKKIEDILIYKDEAFYSSFPSIVRRPDGELVLAFRRAPDRRRLGAESYTHSDPNSYLMLVRSKDSGRTWTKEPQLLFAHPFGGSQDPCMVQLSDHSILCTSYGWASVDATQAARLKPEIRVNKGGFVRLGGFILRSRDGGATWQPPIIPAHPEGDDHFNLFGQPKPAHNRGAMCEGADGRLYWVVQAFVSAPPERVQTHLMISEDKGTTWKYSCPVALDPKVEFNETSIYETPKGDLVAFLRSGNFNDHLCIARSTDHGKSFQPWQDMGFQGHPSYALRLPDKRVLLVYGYRHPPYGIRARVLNAECTDAATAPEVVLRDDGGSGGLGYPWATLISKKRALVVYYFNKEATGTRSIESTVVEIQ